MRKWYLTLAVVCTGWGTIPLIVRTVELPAVAIVFVRLAVAAVALAIGVAVAERRAPRARPRLLSVHPARCVAVAVVLGVHWLTLFSAFKRAPAGTVILIVYLAPVGVAALAPTVLGERHGRRTLLALALAAAGFLLIAGPAADLVAGGGLVFAVVATVFFVALVLLSKPLSETYGGLRLAFMEMAGAAVVVAPFAFASDWGSPRVTWWWLVVLALVHTALGVGVYLAALAVVPATHVGILGYLEPVSVVACAWLFLDESPAVATLVGGTLVVAAGVLVVAGSGADDPEVARVSR
ncbi:MAG TPA: DMT family transporter [Acidimicrobiales bacterium]|nr:DMT family transporter [Acidimicrobiales bacterium]